MEASYQSGTGFSAHSRTKSNVAINYFVQRSMILTCWYDQARGGDCVRPGWPALLLRRCDAHHLLLCSHQGQGKPYWYWQVSKLLVKQSDTLKKESMFQTLLLLRQTPVRHSPTVFAPGFMDLAGFLVQSLLSIFQGSLEKAQKRPCKDHSIYEKSI